MSLVPKNWSAELDKLRQQNKSRLEVKSKGSPAQLAELSRPVSKTSLYYFQQYRRIWVWCFVTLLLDLVLLLGLPLLSSPFLEAELFPVFDLFLSGLCLISLLWIVKDFLIRKISSVKNARGDLLSFLQEKPWIVFILLALLILFEIFSKVGNLGILGSLAVGLIIFLSSIKSLREGLSEKVKSHQDFLGDLTLQVEAFNHTVFILHLLPLLACRIIVLITALLIPLAINFEPFFLLYTCFGCVMISIMQPEEKFFMILCPRCGIKTSRFLADQKQCLACLKGR